MKNPDQAYEFGKTLAQKLRENHSPDIKKDFLTGLHLPKLTEQKNPELQEIYNELKDREGFKGAINLNKLIKTLNAKEDYKSTATWASQLSTRYRIHFKSDDGSPDYNNAFDIFVSDSGNYIIRDQDEDYPIHGTVGINQPKTHHAITQLLHIINENPLSLAA